MNGKCLLYTNCFDFSEQMSGKHWGWWSDSRAALQILSSVLSCSTFWGRKEKLSFILNRIIDAFRTEQTCYFKKKSIIGQHPTILRVEELIRTFFFKNCQFTKIACESCCIVATLELPRFNARPEWQRLSFLCLDSSINDKAEKCVHGGILSGIIDWCWKITFQDVSLCSSHKERTLSSWRY